MLFQTGVNWFLSSPERVDVGAIGGEEGRRLGTRGNQARNWCAMATCGSRTKPRQYRRRKGRA